MRVIGVDVGGTFTDLVCMDEDSGDISIAKVPSTLGDQSLGFLSAMAAAQIPAQAGNAIVHGSTVATNALLERKGAVTGLITTRGFRDVLELRRRDRPKLYGLGGDFQPLVPRHLRVEVDERVNYRGEVLQPLDEDQVLAAKEYLKGQGVEAVVISFIHSYANPVHEMRTRQLLADAWPPERIVASTSVLPEFYEFERTSTAVVSAYVQPMMYKYLSRLRERVRAAGYAQNISVVRSDSGMMSSELAQQQAIQTIGSGPAAGVVAAVATGRAAGFTKLLTGDMGGTSFDICLVADGEPSMRTLTKLEFGIPVKVPMTDITAIGAGGGSIAWIDRGGLLRVGPKSAGAEPGPASYGRGGAEPTVTDANLILGRINAERPLGAGDLKFDVGLARQAVDTKIAVPLGMSVEAAAKAIIDVVNNNMAGAMRMVSVARGYDPRDFAMIAFGGAGPLHACALMRLLELGTVLVPPYPGITSALGCILADIRLNYVQTVNRRLIDLSPAELRAAFEQQNATGLKGLAEQGLEYVRTITLHQADMIYEGQTHAVLVDLPESLEPTSILQQFESTYRRLYGRVLTHVPVRMVSLRTTVTGVRVKPPLDRLAPFIDSTPMRAPSRRSVYFDDAWVDCPIYERRSLPPGTILRGPAIVEQVDSTTVIESGLTLRVDDLGNLILKET